jgi:hypothetical protein
MPMAVFRFEGYQTRRGVSAAVRVERGLSVKRSAAQAAENEATFRRANERLAAKADELELSDARTPYLCECEEERCTEILQLRHDEYEGVRADPRRFVVVPGHQEDDDRLIREGAGFAVIEKAGEEGELVARQDPRSANQ